MAIEIPRSARIDARSAPRRDSRPTQQSSGPISPGPSSGTDSVRLTRRLMVENNDCGPPALADW